MSEGLQVVLIVVVPNALALVLCIIAWPHLVEERVSMLQGMYGPSASRQGQEVERPDGTTP